MKILFFLVPIILSLQTLVGGEVKKDPQAAPEKSKSEKENVMISHTKAIYEGVKGILLRSAEKMPEEYYSFKPTDAVRSYGQIIGHIADSQYYFASLVTGEKNPALKIEKTKTSKAELIAALKEAFAYCDKAFQTMTDATAIQMVKLMGGDMPKLGVFSVINLHDIEHYGNLVTYMRLKNIVPPTSEADSPQKSKKDGIEESKR